MSVEPNEDSTLKIQPNAKLVDFFTNRMKNATGAPKNIRKLKSCSASERSECFLSVKDIEWLNSYLSERRKTSNEKIYIHELLVDADLQLPKPKVTVRSPELEARIKKLTAQQNAREYRAMTKGIDSFQKHHPEDTIAYQSKIIISYFEC